METFRGQRDRLRLASSLFERSQSTDRIILIIAEEASLDGNLVLEKGGSLTLMTVTIGDNAVLTVEASASAPGNYSFPVLDFHYLNGTFSEVRIGVIATGMCQYDKTVSYGRNQIVIGFRLDNCVATTATSTAHFSMPPLLLLLLLLVFSN